MKANITCAVIHGDRTQNQRERALRSFSAGEVDVLVATDVLARGIDIADVNYVVNFDVPEDPVDYIHRIGRTGRGGDVGWSLTFVTEQDFDEFNDIEALMGKTVDLYDTEGLELGENPVFIDPDRVPASKVPGKKAKKKRRKAREKKAASRQTQAGNEASQDRSGEVSEGNEKSSRSSSAGRGRNGKRNQGAGRSQDKKQQAKPSRKNAVRSSDRKRSNGGNGKRRNSDRSTEEVPAAFRPGVRSSGVRQTPKPGKRKRSQGAKNHRGRRNSQ